MNYLGEHLMRDAALDEPLQLYERWYAEYFRTFCDVALAETEEEKNEVALMETLKPLLKYRLAEARQAILQMPWCRQKSGVKWRFANQLATRSECARCSVAAVRVTSRASRSGSAGCYQRVHPDVGKPIGGNRPL